jgi:membrane fusion protein, copper/silver efflux system
MTLHAPSSGVVTERLVQVGQAVQAGMPLYRLADLSRVWVEADVYESDLRFVRTGEHAHVTIDAYPGPGTHGVISYIYPDVRIDTRTARVRIVMDNPGGLIKPGMFATVHLDAPVAEQAVMVPRDAVMRSGDHDMVFVERSPGIFEPRRVEVGQDADGRSQIVSGLLAGERVVARANFILDAESRLLQSTSGDMPGMNH